MLKEPTHAPTVHFRVRKFPFTSTLSVLLAFIKTKFNSQKRRGKGVGVRGIYHLQNQRVISKTLNISAINVHSPGGGGPAMASPAVRRPLEGKTTPAEGHQK